MSSALNYGFGLAFICLGLVGFYVPSCQTKPPISHLSLARMVVSFIWSIKSCELLTIHDLIYGKQLPHHQDSHIHQG